jgi:hypothetical protein
MQRVLLALAIVSAPVCLPSSSRAEEPEKPQAKQGVRSFWMEKKLDYSQAILSGLATADFDEVGKNARAMNGLSEIEKFVRGKTPGYRTQLKFFRFTNDELIRQSDRGNLDGAALAFTQLTLTCVNCHKHIRDTAPEEQ